ncbi:exodeoxyribonuclease VII large subunit [Thermomonas sp.]|uniref:exodeoxyribonuclease VII large subunit n=1 Tax=Thermomonas sp. TaxID=1971895 RepID=UPI0024875636|nr:exodeoxyribonuclease VII large subunit [Thermomonas sp.]MDI1253752.1 exodeoxyribonuclease VII large subunit [Thermomonas sp.]
MQDDQQHILTPSQLNTLARDLLEGAFPLVLVEGEIGNMSRPGSGHLYFTLKDARAQVRCALFKPKSQWLKFAPREGLRVLARGRLTLYEARGDYQLVLDSIEDAGEGALRRALDELKARLQAEGLFDAARKRALPAWPRRLAVLTSPSGAVIRDIVSVLRRRFPLVELDLLPVPVQGDTAAAQIRAMLQRAIDCGRYDAILLARGGGSLEDLWAFNDEALARMIAASPVPVVSAIGHETDFSLSDFAADLRAPTPSAAAELLVPDRTALSARLDALHRRLITLQQHAARERNQRADHAFLRLQAMRPQARLSALAQRAQQANARLSNAMQRRLERDRASLRHADSVLRASHPRRTIERLRERLASLQGRPQVLLARRLQHDALRLRGLARSLHAISPLATVARGYSILQHDDGRIVRSIGDAAAGDILDARLHDGHLQLQVQGKH